MKKILSLFLFGILLVSCEQDYELDSLMEQEESVVSKELTLEQKLLNMQNRTEEVLSRSSNIYNTDLKLKDYNYAGIIDTEQELEELKKDILSDDSYFPYYDMDYNKVIPLTWNEIKNAKQYDCIEYSKQKLSNYIDEHIKIGMGILMLTWESESEAFSSICIYSGNKFVYDNIILNTLCVREEEKPIERKVLVTVKTRSELPPVSETKTLVNESVCWLDGTIRGSVEITHTISGVNGYMYGSDCNATVEIDNGNAEAGSLITKRELGINGYSICRYAYCLASPEVSISISIDYKVASIGMSVSGAGQKRSVQGEDTFYSSSIMTF